LSIEAEPLHDLVLVACDSRLFVFFSIGRGPEEQNASADSIGQHGKSMCLRMGEMAWN
jgi:hypothetical protein